MICQETILMLVVYSKIFIDPVSKNMINDLYSEAQDARILPWMIEWPLNMSATVCMEQCAAFGYPAAGVEVSSLSLLYLIAYCSLNIYLVWYPMLCDLKFTR